MAASDPTSAEKLAKMKVPDLMAFAKVTEEAERYKDMIKVASCAIKLAYNVPPPTQEALKAIADEKGDAGKESFLKEYMQEVKDRRNHVSVAYKNVVGGQRNAWRLIRDKAVGDGPNSNVDEAALAQKYQKYLREVITSVCNKVINLITTSPLKGYDIKSKKKAEKCYNVEDTVFWLKMVGDYCRYLAELDKDYENAADKVAVTLGGDKGAAEWAELYYEAAVNLCGDDGESDGLKVTHPIRLGLALNFSVCYYECLGKPNKAIAMAKQAFDKAIEKLDTLNDESYKDSTLIMQLLRDNMTLWQQEQQDTTLQSGDAGDQA